MRKVVCLGLSALVGVSGLLITGCGGTKAKNSYTITAAYFPDEGRLACEMTVQIVNNTEVALDTLPFQLWPNAYREGAQYKPVSPLYEPAAYYEGESYGGITVSAVEGATYTVGGEDENILYAALEKTLYPDESVTLDFTFEVTLAHINHRLGIGERCVNLANFYPVLCAYRGGEFLECVYSETGDPFVSECANYCVELIVPAGYQVIGATAAGENVYTYHAENVRDVAFVLGENFESVEGEACGVPVTYWYLEDENPDFALTAACESLTYFADAFGEYAYTAYNVVQTDFPYGGMEYPSLAIISTSLLESEVAHAVVHETAHQWWYAMVGSNQFEEAWQDEGLAEYSTALFFENHSQYGVGYRETISASESAYRAFFSVYSQVSKQSNTAMSRPLVEYSGDYEYRNIAYDKGVILFDRVCDVAGEKKLLRALSIYAERYNGKIAAPADLISCFSAAGANVEELILSFTEGRCVI